MIERRPVTCNLCSGEIAAGILFCWRHPTNPPKVGEFLEDHGQLVWRTTMNCAGHQERAVAVLLDGLQVQVRLADEAPQVRPARVNLEVGNPSNTGAAATPVFVPMTALLEALLAGDEQVEALRFV